MCLLPEDHSGVSREPTLAFRVVGSSLPFSHEDIIHPQTCHHLDPLSLQSPSLLHKLWQVGLGRAEGKGLKDSRQHPLLGLRFC